MRALRGARRALLQPRISSQLPNYAEYLQSFVDAGTLPLWLRFRETSGTSAANSGSSGATLDGTNSNATVAQDGQVAANEAYDWNGTTSFVSVPNEAAVQTASFEVACLVRPDGNGEGSTGTLFAHGNGSSTPLIQVALTGGNVLRFGVGASGGFAGSLSTANAYTADVWQWFFLTYDNAGDRTPRIYKAVDGVVTDITATPATVSGTLNALAGVLLYVGNRQDNTATFDGRFDEFLRFNRVLTSDERTAIAQASRA